jgi:peptidyl-prolyl cis-trans isomerase SurA
MKRLTGLITASLIALGTTITLNAATAQSFRVAAVVNEEIISTLDLGARIEMIVRSTNLPATNETRQQLAPQMLRMLIDEKLKMQEAERLNITITPTDLNTAIATIEQRNNIPAGQFRDAMDRQGVPYESVIEQIRADLSWNRIVSRRIAGQISLDDTEVREATEHLKSITGKPEHDFSEIFLSTSAPADAAEVQALALQLISDIQSGAPFEQVARQFSQSVYASEGGRVGWMAPGEIEPEIENALLRMEPGEVAGPVEAFGGLAILRLNNRRLVGGAPRVTIDLTQIVFELPTDASDQAVEDARARASQVAAMASSCDSFNALGQQYGSDLSGPLGQLQLNEMPKAISQVVSPLRAGQVSPPTRTDAGVVLYMVCARDEERAEINEEQVRERLRLQRIQLQAERYLQDLRRAAFVEIRL